jgi:basic amino acid/polyamine antiporter, APA family
MDTPTSETIKPRADGRDDLAPTIAPRLGLWDAVSIIVGIVVGTGIFRSTGGVFHSAGGPWGAMGLWLVGGALTLCGALCYAELATTYPRDGGDYEYLSRAFGPWCGFLFAWIQLTAVISGNIAIMAYAFADYGLRLWPWMKDETVWLTAAPVVAFSLLNACGVVAGKATQNVLSAAKVFGLVAVVLAAIFVGGAEPPAEVPATSASAAISAPPAPNWGLALVFVLYTYGGWGHAVFVAAEVRDQRHNMPRALVVAMLGITLIYLAVNGAYLHVLGYDGARATRTPAADVLEVACGPWGSRAVSVLVMLSALGAINGMILTGTRVYAIWGEDYPAFGWLSRWNRRVAAPIHAIAVQAAVAVALILLVGTAAGRDGFDAALHSIGAANLPWEQYFGGFEMLVAGSAPVFWAFLFLGGLAVFVLRANDASVERPFKVPLYPVPPLVFCGSSLYMLYSSLAYAGWLTLIGVVPLLVGAALLPLMHRRSASVSLESK